jgi:hypothetical protein
MIRLFMGPAFFACLAAPPALAAAQYDGSRPFMCTATDIVSCRSGGKCDKETSASVDLPQFLKFDVTQNQITGARPNGETLKAAIERVQHVNDHLLLQGTEQHIQWAVSVGEESGNMTITAGGDHVGFIAFGTCTSG